MSLPLAVFVRLKQKEDIFVMYLTKYKCIQIKELQRYLKNSGKWCQMNCLVHIFLSKYQ